MNITMKKTLVCTALLGTLGGLSKAHAADAKNVILFIGDGMGPTVLTATRLFKVGEEGDLEMMKLPQSARIKTFSHDAQTTDSAPSMAAYTTGVKMNNEVIAMSSDTRAVAPSKDANGNKGINNCTSDNGSPVPTILELAKAAGKSVGAVTTTELTHATPAATYSHICHRDAAYAIAEQAVPGGAGFNQALGDGVDVLMGGGANHWTPYSASNKGGRADGRDLTAELTARGYRYVTTKDELSAVNSGKVLGLFSTKSHLDYELDRVAKGAASTQPSLSEMTAKAIDLLSQNSQGYFLMVEGGAYRPRPACHQRQAIADRCGGAGRGGQDGPRQSGFERYPDRGYRRPRPHHDHQRLFRQGQQGAGSGQERRWLDPERRGRQAVHYSGIRQRPQPPGPAPHPYQR